MWTGRAIHSTQNMAYDLHIVRTEDWTQSSRTPITKQEVNDLISNDPELEWSKTNYVDMNEKTGVTTRYYMICWRGSPCFWWYRDKIECSRPDEAQKLKLTTMARGLHAFVVGDDGEQYESKKNLFGKEKVFVIG
jgi:hypothetical protein